MFSLLEFAVVDVAVVAVDVFFFCFLLFFYSYEIYFLMTTGSSYVIFVVDGLFESIEEGDVTVID